MPAPGIQWEHGAIRGGTPPVPYDDGHLVTFFHSSQVMGSRNVYSVGACVFQARPPYAPVFMTTEPLLIAPYRERRASFRLAMGDAALCSRLGANEPMRRLSSAVRTRRRRNHNIHRAARRTQGPARAAHARPDRHGA